MAAKKPKKSKQAQQPSAVESVRLAQERLQSNRPDDAIVLLRRAEGEIHRAGSRPPPHLAALQPRLAELMGRAFFLRGLAATNRKQQRMDLNEAARWAPEETRYLVASALVQAADGEAEAALALLEPAQAKSPADPLVAHAHALALLAAGRTRAFREQMKATPDADRDPHLKRLADLRSLLIAMKPSAEADPSPASLPSATAFHAALFRGLRHLSAGEHAPAREALGTLPPLDASPSRTEAAVLATQLFYSGATALQIERYGEAGADIVEAHRLARTHALSLPWQERLAPAFHAAATGAITTGELDLAATCWEHVLQLDPADKVAVANLRLLRRALADRAWHAGDRERAIALWSDLVDAQHDDDESLRKLAIALDQVGKKEESLDDWRTLAARWRGRLKTHADDAALRERLRQLEEHLISKLVEGEHPPATLRAEFEAALKSDPENQTLRLRYVRLLLEMDEPQPALKQLETIERRQGESAELLLQKAETLSALGRTERARQAAERAMELDPSHPTARHVYMTLLGDEAVAAADDGEFEEAIEICLKQLAFDANYVPALRQMADLYYDLGQESDARQTLQRLIDIDPKNALNRVIAGGVYLQNERPRLATAEFKRAIEIEPSMECYLGIGLLYGEADRWKQAATYLEQAARLGPYEMGSDIVRTLLDERRTADAERVVEILATKAPDHPEIPLFRAGIAHYRDRDTAALTELEECLRLAEGKPEFAQIVEQAHGLKQQIEGMPELDFNELLRRIQSMPDFADLMAPKPRKRR